MNQNANQKIWVDKGSEFFNRPMKSWLKTIAIEMHSRHNEGKSVVAKRFSSLFFFEPLYCTLNM